MDSEWENEGSEMEAFHMQRGGCSPLQEDFDDTISEVTAEEAEPTTSVPVAKRKRLKPEEVCTRGHGALEGYFIKIDSERREEYDYDFVSFPWVESLVARTRSIYSDKRTISAFVDSRDVVEGNLPGNVECSWMMEDDRVCSHQMAPKLDKKALVLEMKRQRLAKAEKDKVGVSSSTVAPEPPILTITQLVVPSSSVAAPRKQSRTEKTLVPVTGQTSDKGDTPGKGVVEIFQPYTGSSVEMAFLGRYLELKSKNEKMTHFDLGDKVADLETKLQGYEEMKTKVVELEGRVALLGQENTKLKEDKITAEKSLVDMTSERDLLKLGLDKEKLRVKATQEKYTIDFQQLNFDAAKSYGLGFEQALVQAKHFNPTVDISECDPLKELVNGVLVDLGEGEEDHGSSGPDNEEEIVDSQGGEINKPTEDSNRAGNEEQGDVPLE
ncbi:hypothetical protein SESBI_36333 [Sesbania bispinosa]|nr:hypothetical protein SESBI_36333 [Sesbania bispinosa]